jgi:hypothetical protein
MPIIDVQVHAYERNHPGRPWAGQLHGPESATGPPGGGIIWVAIAASYRAPIAKVTRPREHSGEAMPGPFGSFSG